MHPHPTGDQSHDRANRKLLHQIPEQCAVDAHIVPVNDCSGESENQNKRHRIVQSTFNLDDLFRSSLEPLSSKKVEHSRGIG